MLKVAGSRTVFLFRLKRDGKAVGLKVDEVALGFVSEAPMIILQN
jgi:hypothetical protein